VVTITTEYFITTRISLVMNNLNKTLNWSWWRGVMNGLIIFMLVLSAILTWHFLTGKTMIGCTGNSPCNQVLNTRWSTIAGIIPVSGLAIGLYMAMLFSGFYSGTTTDLQIRRLAWKILLILAGAVTGCAIWFTAIQLWIIDSICLYCFTIHVTGLLLSILIYWQSTKQIEKPNRNSLKPEINNDQKKSAISVFLIKPFKAIGLLIIGLALAVIVALAQIGLTPSSVYNTGESEIKLPDIDYQKAPIIGSPDAPYVVTILFDYQCTHCQKLHFMLKDVFHQYNGKLAFVLCPTPLDGKCNQYIPPGVVDFENSCELAKTGLAVWLAKPEVFQVFEDWMFTFETGNQWHPRNHEDVRTKAIELVGKTEFENAWSNPWIDKYLHTCVQIFGKTIQDGKGGIPKLIYEAHWVIPEPQNVNDLIDILQKGLALPSP
jgi:uncharacterized membrane protein